MSKYFIDKNNNIFFSFLMGIRKNNETNSVAAAIFAVGLPSKEDNEEIPILPNINTIDIWSSPEAQAARSWIRYTPENCKSELFCVSVRYNRTKNCITDCWFFERNQQSPSYITKGGLPKTISKESLMATDAVVNVLRHHNIKITFGDKLSLNEFDRIVEAWKAMKLKRANWEDILAQLFKNRGNF